jgi:hypothetical protein
MNIINNNTENNNNIVDNRIFLQDIDINNIILYDINNNYESANIINPTHKDSLFLDKDIIALPQYINKTIHDNKLKMLS